MFTPPCFAHLEKKIALVNLIRCKLYAISNSMYTRIINDVYILVIFVNSS